MYYIYNNICMIGEKNWSLPGLWFSSIVMDQRPDCGCGLDWS